MFSLSGGRCMISSWVTDSAPWRTEVPMQSDPVSPPPMTTTCLPPARMGRLSSCGSFGDPPVLLRQEIHREMDPVEIAAGDGQVARLLRPARQHHRIEAVDQLAGVLGHPDVGFVVEAHAFGASSCATRRSIRCFSILKSGMP